jgi:glycogen debranching enzyme
VYNIPGFGSLVFCGLEGWMHPVRQMVQSNDLGHPLAAHLRDGCWAMDYVHDRVQK